MGILGKKFYERNTKKVAKELLGKILVHGRKRGKIVETEAYLGKNDPGSKGCRNVKSAPKVLLGSAGHAFVYFTYGNHWMLNAVTEKEGKAGAVLIRAIEPIANVKNTSGPGRLTKAFRITGKHSGKDLTRGRLYIEDSKERPKIVTTTRIGLSKGSDLKLRYYIRENKFISRK
ncbi:MAG: DNA-3-methyladenine glycosylase [Candidatus Aenigmatarchaeota archaeon]